MNILKKTATLARLYAGYQRRNTVVSAPPIRLWVESSLACNLCCVMCPNRQTPRTGSGLMEFALFKKIIDEAALFVNDIFLQHRGEPLLNPHIFDMIRYAKQRGVTVRMHTNATLLDRHKTDELLDSGLDLLSCSVDGWQKDVYEAVRVGARFETTRDNIYYLLERKRELKRSFPYVVVERIDLREFRSRAQSEEVELFKDQMRRRGVNELLEKQEFHWMTDSAPSCGLVRRFNACTLPWYAMIICYDGTVLPCMQDFFCAYPLGNVKNHSIRRIWNDEPYRQFRRNLIAADPSLHLCAKCDRLCRKQVAGIPYQYLIKFLTDHFVGYGRLRRLIGSGERN